MIAYLQGRPIINAEELIILTNGVGYEVKVTTTTLMNLSGIEQAELYIYSHVKEDSFTLYGFNAFNDKQLFKLLISVSGVGPATAINILNKGSNEVINAIQNADVAFFTSVKRVGKKAGQKIIIELKTKLGGIKDLNLTPLNQMQADILEALVSIGFEENQANQTIIELELSNLPLEEAITMAIKHLGKNK